MVKKQIKWQKNDLIFGSFFDEKMDVKISSII